MARKARREPSGESAGRIVDGMVERLQGSKVLVGLADGRLRCTLRKTLFRDLGSFTGPVAVGDRVRVRVFGPGDAVVEEVLPRRGYLSRRQPESGREQVVVANLDQVVITASLKEPDLRPRVIDRILVAAERGGFATVIALTKTDLTPERTPYEDLADLYRRLGYAVLFLSVVTGEGIDELRRLLRGRTSVFAGQSGVGKTSLLNVLEPSLELRTREISRKWGKGRHTTSAVWCHPLAGGGSVVDTPGIRAFAIAGLDPTDVAIFFRDLAAHVDGCRLPSCTHDHEPDCAVKAAVAGGLVDPRRYESYLRILKGMEEDED